MGNRDPAATPTAGSAESVRARALSLGFDAVGFAPPQSRREAREGLRAFLAGGHHGDMGWLAAKEERRSSPDALWPDTGTVIALGMNYGPAEDPMAGPGRPDRGTVSVYARTNRDYHDLLKGRLKQLAGWLVRTHGGAVKVFVDTAPVMEKPAAADAGIGWQGKHTNLVSRDFGSWLFLGELFTSLAFPPDPPHADRCGRCRACLDICPTAAFPAPYRLDARRCLSYLTIEHKGPIPREFRRAMGNRIYGCDDCLAVCPWNRFARRAREPGLMPRVELAAPELADLAGLDEAGFRRVFAGSPIRRTGRARFVRNVLVAIGNSGDPGLIPHAERLLDDTSPLVRGAAVWALGELLPAEGFARLRSERAGPEADASVVGEWSYPR